MRPDDTQGEWGEVASDMLGFVGSMVSLSRVVLNTGLLWIPYDSYYGFQQQS